MQRTISVGIDLVRLDRMRELIEHHRERALGDLFSEIELGEARRESREAAGSLRLNDEFDIRLLAGKYAAKEATVKALAVPPSLGYRFSDISITGRSHITIGLSERLQGLARERVISSFHGQMSWGREMVMAIVFGVSYD